jgi:hypothetical protein
MLTSQVREYSRLPVNMGIVFVPQQEAWVIERMGKFNKILSPVSPPSPFFRLLF